MKLEYFIGRVCTIFTTPTNRNFKEESPKTYPAPLYQYFTGMVESIDDQGILITQVMSKERQKSYFFIQNVIGIAEEMPLNPEIPEHAEEIRQIKSKLNKDIPAQKNHNELIDPDYMEKLNEHMKKTY